MKKAIVILPLNEEERKQYESVQGFDFSFKEADELTADDLMGASLVIGNLSPEKLKELAAKEAETKKVTGSSVMSRMLNQPLILASASPRRRELLTKADIPFVVMPADIEEISVAGEPADVAEEISSYKAEYVADKVIRENKQESFMVLSADTIVSIDGRILGKPKDEEEAFEVLKQEIEKL